MTEDQTERYEEALLRIVQWADAYPLDIFPEPDFKQAHEILDANDGPSLDAISAWCMKHVIDGVGKIAKEALSGTKPSTPTFESLSRVEATGALVRASGHTFDDAILIIAALENSDVLLVREAHDRGAE